MSANAGTNWLMVCKWANGVHFVEEFETISDAMSFMRESPKDFTLVKMYPISEKARDCVNLIIGN